MRYGKMSRVGKKPIDIPEGVKVEIEGQRVKVEGPKGTLERVLHEEIGIKQEGSHLVLFEKRRTKRSRALWGLERQLVNNMIIGVTQGYQKRLEVVGIGYRASMQGENLVLEVGFSHPVVYTPPQHVKIEVEGNNKIIVSGIDKYWVGQVAAQIRKIRKPDPYKGKGIRYEGEQVRLKPGKRAATT